MLTEAQIKHMVDRFLGWRLPKNFRPDGGISFKADYNEGSPWPMRNEPTGTNLFDATQAMEMVRCMVEGMPEADRDEKREAVIQAARAWVKSLGWGYEGSKEFRATVEALAAITEEETPKS